MNAIPIHDIPLLLVDDEPMWLRSMERAFRICGFGRVFSCLDPTQAFSMIREHGIRVVLLDISMPTMRGELLLEQIRSAFPEVSVFMVTAIGDVETAVACMKAGAENYVIKPVNTSQLVGMVSQSLALRALAKENESLRNRLLNNAVDHPEHFADILTDNQNMQHLFSYIELIAPSDEVVLITGETGTGKELFAQAVHRSSGRKGQFVAVNVAGVDEMAFTDTLFGHRRGAFTGAMDERKGLVEQARDGTLFLDEIGCLDPKIQVKLLRLIQEQEYMPLGSDTPIRSTCRIVAATNRNLRDLCTDGSFRDDLFYRLHTHHVAIPPLRERLEDIPLLAEAFLKEAALQYKTQPAQLHPEASKTLARHSFPGNVRELRSILFNAAAQYGGRTIPPGALLNLVPDNESATSNLPTGSWMKTLRALPTLPTLRDAQTTLIQEALRRTNLNQSAAAGLLGITRQALHQRLKNMDTSTICQSPT